MSGAVLDLSIELRRRAELFVGSGEWSEFHAPYNFSPQQAALIICDMWDKHWSSGAAKRAAMMAPAVNELAARLRDKGSLIIHAPSDTLEFYSDHPARTRLAEVPSAVLPEPLPMIDPPLPIDDSDGGSDTGETDQRNVWSRQHPDIEICDVDAISDDGQEIYSLLRQVGIRTVLMAGVHTNMCVLNRSFGIKNLVRWGLNTTLVRDLTDAMYNPAMPPYVTHDQGTELVVEHIEKYWCPTTTSTRVLA